MSILLFKDGDFRGQTLFLTESTTNFAPLGFNDVVSSIKVLSGTWRLYQNVNYTGKFLEVVPGSYNIDVFSITIGNDKVSSALKLS